LEGDVVDVYNAHIKKSGNWSGNTLKGLIGLMLLPFRPLMVLIALIFSPRQTPEMQEVIVLRVENAVGRLIEARIEADIHGAGVRLGDHVTLWGQYRSGVLIVRRGYNHSSGADIRMSGGGGVTQIVQIFAIIVIILFLMSICSLMSSFRVFTPF